MDIPPCEIDPEEDCWPRCPYGHGHMVELHADGTVGAQFGIWWRCEKRNECAATYLAPSDMFLFLASRPAGNGRPILRVVPPDKP